MIVMLGVLWLGLECLVISIALLLLLVARLLPSPIGFVVAMAVLWMTYKRSDGPLCFIPMLATWMAAKCFFDMGNRSLTKGVP